MTVDVRAAIEQTLAAELQKAIAWDRYSTGKKPPHPAFLAADSDQAHEAKRLTKAVIAALVAVVAQAQADAWEVGRGGSDCECGHSIVAHPKDNYRHCVRDLDCGCGGYETRSNPYRADALTPTKETT